VNDVDFPAFVATLIHGVFNAIVNASLQQMGGLRRADLRRSDRTARDTLADEFRSSSAGPGQAWLGVQAPSRAPGCACKPHSVCESSNRTFATWSPRRRRLARNRPANSRDKRLDGHQPHRRHRRQDHSNKSSSTWRDAEELRGKVRSS